MTFLGTIFTDDRTAATYGLVAAAHLAQNDGWISAKDVAAAYGLPTGYMFKTMHDLARAGGPAYCTTEQDRPGRRVCLGGELGRFCIALSGLISW